MDEDHHFDAVFAELHDALFEEAGASNEQAVIKVLPALGASREELDEIDALRRIVLEVTEPELMSFTTT